MASPIPTPTLPPTDPSTSIPLIWSTYNNLDTLITQLTQYLGKFKMGNLVLDKELPTLKCKVKDLDQAISSIHQHHHDDTYLKARMDAIVERLASLKKHIALFEERRRQESTEPAQQEEEDPKCVATLAQM